MPGHVPAREGCDTARQDLDLGDGRTVPEHHVGGVWFLRTPEGLEFRACRNADGTWEASVADAAAFLEQERGLPDRDAAAAVLARHAGRIPSAGTHTAK